MSRSRLLRFVGLIISMPSLGAIQANSLLTPTSQDDRTFVRPAEPGEPVIGASLDEVATTTPSPINHLSVDLNGVVPIRAAGTIAVGDKVAPAAGGACIASETNTCGVALTPAVLGELVSVKLA